MCRTCTPITEQYRLVIDCRQDGLSDARWCQENGIHSSTFYNWVNNLHKKGCEISPLLARKNFFRSQTKMWCM